ncbi:hypothetical protein [Streptomyces tateyamensis]|nr:hypothetical protein [Streptomyces tateyamensis]
MSDSRAYQQHDCTESNENTATFDAMLQHYAIAQPSGVEGLRYYSADTAFNGPDTLKFPH